MVGKGRVETHRELLVATDFQTVASVRYIYYLQDWNLLSLPCCMPVTFRKENACWLSTKYVVNASASSVEKRLLSSSSPAPRFSLLLSPSPISSITTSFPGPPSHPFSVFIVEGIVATSSLPSERTILVFSRFACFCRCSPLPRIDTALRSFLKA